VTMSGLRLRRRETALRAVRTVLALLVALAAAADALRPPLRQGSRITGLSRPAHLRSAAWVGRPGLSGSDLGTSRSGSLSFVALRMATDPELRDQVVEAGLAEEEEQGQGNPGFVENMANKVTEVLKEGAKTTAQWALGIGIAVLVLYGIALQLTHVQLYGMPVVEMSDNIMDWKILGVPASLFAVTSGYVIFRAVRVVISVARLLVILPALGGGVIAASQITDAAGKLNDNPVANALGITSAVKDAPPGLVIALPELIAFTEGILLSALIGGLVFVVQKTFSSIGGSKKKSD